VTDELPPGLYETILDAALDERLGRLDKRLIDKVQIYLGPILAGGPVIAFPGEGVEKTADALRLRDVEYQHIGQTVSLTGYPDLPSGE
jgi:riboflavin biosynthesis pyrimidine reductase